MKIVRISKQFRRVVSDNNYGSVASSTDLTVETDLSTEEELLKINTELSKQVRQLTMQDLKEFFDLKQKQVQ